MKEPETRGSLSASGQVAVKTNGLNAGNQLYGLETRENNETQTDYASVILF